MGILKRLLKKREKPDGGKRLDTSGDLQVQEGNKVPTPPEAEAIQPVTDLIETDRMAPVTDDTTRLEQPEPEGGTAIQEPQPVRIEQEPKEERATPVGLREGVHIAEQSLTQVEWALVALAQSIPSEEASIARIKILLMEAKIPLAEAGIRIAETEITPGTTVQKLAEAEERLAAVESRIIEAERAVIPLASKAQRSPSSLADVKIGLATAKIRVSQARIQLTNAMFLPGAGGEKTPSYPETVRKPIQLPREEPVRAPMVPPSIRSTDRGDDPLLPPSPVRITDEPQSPEKSVDRDRSLEPVKFQFEEKPKVSESDLKTRVIMGGLDEEEESPFDTGISSARVRINDEGEASPPVPTTKEPMKIRSDERESAWVSADGTLKDKVMEREAGSSPPRDEEGSRIAISQPAPQKDIIIEELNRKGIELRQKGKLIDALECFSRVLSLDPRNVAALHNRGVALRAEGRFEEALASFERVIEQESTNPLVWFNKAFVLSKLQRYEEAIKSFDRVLALEPSNAAAWYNKGKLLALLGRREESDQHLEKARELGYSGGAPQTQ